VRSSAGHGHGDRPVETARQNGAITASIGGVVLPVRMGIILIHGQGHAETDLDVEQKI